MNTYTIPFRDELGCVEVCKMKTKFDRYSLSYRPKDISVLYISEKKSKSKSKSTLMLSLCKHNYDEEIFLDLKNYSFPVPNFHIPNIVEDAIRMSLKLHPRHYLFCKINNVDEMLGYLEYAELMKTLYKDVLNNDWSIILSRLSFITSFGRRNFNSVTYGSIQQISNLMRCYKYGSIISYNTFGVDKW